MEFAIRLALWVHLIALAMGGAATFGIPALLGLVAKADPAQKPVFGLAIMRLSAIGRMGLVLLILSGGAMLVWKYAGVVGLGVWFWIKMVLVAGLIGLMVFNIFNGRRIRAGNALATARAPMLSKLGMGLLSGIVLAAVLAFA